MKKLGISNAILLIFAVGIIAFFSLSYLFVPQKSFSEYENRKLQTMPSFSIEKLLDGTYTHQLHDYFSDQISLRTQMIEAKAVVELLLGKKENNSILLGKNNYLIEKHQYTSKNYSFLQQNLNKIENLEEKLKSNNIKVHSFIVPRKIDVLQNYLPNNYSNEHNKIAWELVDEDHMKLYKILNLSENIFYKSDHHWTAEGAYFAYCTIANELGVVPYPLEHFNLKTLSNDFCGTTYSKSGFFFLEGEEIKAPSIESGKYTMTIVDTGATFDTLYDMSYINTKDKYSIFLNGNNAHVKIFDNKNDKKETLLLIKDSFSHSLAPYLCEHFNIELIDPRYYNDSIEKYIIENNIKNVVFLLWMDTLASGNVRIR